MPNVEQLLSSHNCPSTYQLEPRKRYSELNYGWPLFDKTIVPKLVTTQRSKSDKSNLLFNSFPSYLLSTFPTSPPPHVFQAKVPSKAPSSFL